MEGNLAILEGNFVHIATIATIATDMLKSVVAAAALTSASDLSETNRAIISCFAHGSDYHGNLANLCIGQCLTYMRLKIGTERLDLLVLSGVCCTLC